MKTSECSEDYKAIRKYENIRVFLRLQSYKKVWKHQSVLKITNATDVQEDYSFCPTNLVSIIYEIHSLGYP